MYCSQCGAENADTSKFCAKCGAQLLSARQPTTAGRQRRTYALLGGGLLVLIVVIVGILVFISRGTQSVEQQSVEKKTATSNAQKEVEVQEQVEVHAKVSVTADVQPNAVPSRSANEQPVKDAPMPVQSADPLVYPNSEALDVSSLSWEDVALPEKLTQLPQSLLEHRAWCTEDRAVEVMDFFTEALAQAKWEPVGYLWADEEIWYYSRFEKGDEVQYVAVAGNLSSADIAHLAGLELTPGETLIVTMAGNPFEALLAQGRQMLDQGDWRVAKYHAETVIRMRTAAGVGEDDSYLKDAQALLVDGLKLMSPLDAAREWFSTRVTMDIFDPDKGHKLEQMLRLGLVLEYRGYDDATIIDSYLATGDWQELSSDDSQALVEFEGVAKAMRTNRLIATVPIEAYVYNLHLGLQRNEQGIWVVDEESGFTESALKDRQSLFSSEPTFNGNIEDINSHWPFTLHVTSFDDRSGDFLGEVEWTTLDTVARVEGKLADTTLTFKGTEYIREGDAILGVTYTLHLKYGEEMNGTWEGAGQKGRVWLSLRPESDAN